MSELRHPWLEPLLFRDGRSLPNHIIPGPMEGISEGSFVDVFSELDLVSSWFTPFIRISNGVPRMARLQEKLDPYLRSGKPVVAQIMGVHIPLLAEAARRLHLLGATCVDLNCACPSKVVIGNGSGGYHLKSPQWMTEAIKAMKAASGEHGISVKIRCGYDSPDEMEAICEAIAEAEPDLVTCHFRTVKEGYRPIVDGLARLRKVRDYLPKIQLIGSGNLFTLEDVRRMLEMTGVDGVAPARGLLKNPALLREIEAFFGGRPLEWRATPEARAELLEAVGNRCGRQVKNKGFVLKIAKIMYGESSQEFSELMNHFKG